MTPLQTAILRTLAYFDVADFPLTVAELWQWLYPAAGQRLSVTRDEVAAALDTPELRSRTEQVGEHVVLRGRASLVETRRQRHEFGMKKWRRANSAAQFLEIVPYVKLVAVSNTLAYDNAKESSDIDYVIVTTPGHLWSVRMMVTGIVSMLGLRRHGDKIRDRICLSFYLTTDVMDFSKLLAGPDDAHRLFLTAQLVPLMDDDKTFEAYRRENAWVTERLPNAWSETAPSRLLKPNGAFRTIKAAFESAFHLGLGQTFEHFARNRQLEKMAKNTHSRAGEPTMDVIINDQMLKFHENDALATYNRRFREKLTELGLPS